MPSDISVYDQPHQFEPLLPQKELDDLAHETRAVTERALALKAAIHPASRARLHELLRSMNSYYSNLIEGQSTHPAHIDRALRQDFSATPDIALRQRIALAHIDAERELEALATDETMTLSAAFLQRAHASLYGRLAPDDRRTDDGRVVEPGLLRQEDVAVGRHQPPAWRSIPKFLHRADSVYARRVALDARIYTVAAAHHRMTWVHPFADGNGRACRLQTHCALLPLSAGLWSISRGLARQRARYYELLSNADMPRHGDLDGRGNLSERMLREWCRFFIELCGDQARFMEDMLDLGLLRERIAALVLIRSQSATHSDYRREALLPLHHVLAAGPVSRADFSQMTGLGERTARKMIARLLADGLLVSDSPKGEVGIGFPLDTLSILFPNLYPEAATTPPPG
ncbi:Fic family protein [Rhizobacter sp. OV335]|uniref:Fic family protein n=1 Tax=Rhizobacter sp. OV335 TaxID=1500264 RepID=UPI00091CF0AA|nr:Fic family protein [Rhizobacter sp. OV335]SHN18141.1 Fic family protein [Rhizobacter sp. OV335]